MATRERIPTPPPPPPKVIFVVSGPGGLTAGRNRHTLFVMLLQRGGFPSRKKQYMREAFGPNSPTFHSCSCDKLPFSFNRRRLLCIWNNCIESADILYVNRFGTSSPRKVSASYCLCFCITKTKQSFWLKGDCDMNVFGNAKTEQRYNVPNCEHSNGVNFFSKRCITLNC
jgi:hypothetical protein